MKLKITISDILAILGCIVFVISIFSTAWLSLVLTAICLLLIAMYVRSRGF